MRVWSVERVIEEKFFASANQPQRTDLNGQPLVMVTHLERLHVGKACMIDVASCISSASPVDHRAVGEKKQVRDMTVPLGPLYPRRVTSACIDAYELTGINVSSGEDAKTMDVAWLDVDG